MSFCDLANRILQQVTNSANNLGTWTRKKVLNIRRQRRKSTTPTTTNAATAATTTAATQKSRNDETNKRESKHKRTSSFPNPTRFCNFMEKHKTDSHLYGLLNLNTEQ